MFDRFRTSPVPSAILTAGLLLPTNSAAQNPQRTDGTSIVDAAWVAERLGSAELVLIHIGSRTDYDKEHIPGAVHLSLSQIAVADSLRLQLPPVAQLDSVFESLGVSDNSTIVLYFGSNWVTPLTRVYLTLDYLGLGAHTYVLNGGMPAWQKAGYPLTAETHQVRAGSLTPRIRADLIADADWLHANLENPKVTILDARTPEFYSGSRGGHGMPRAGHIPGAKNLPFPSVLEDETLEFKDMATLRALFAAAGAEPGDQVVSYCHIGQQATLVYFTARLLGYEARVYDGSFEEWSNRAGLPVVWPAQRTLAQLISTEELANQLASEQMAIVDMRSNLFEYLAGHIPGATYLHYETLRATKGGVPADVLGAESYAALFSQLGIRRDRPVVIYGHGDSQNFNATFLAWILTGFGHPSVYLLDGGYAKWTAEARPVSRQYPEVEPSEFAAQPFDLHLADRDWVVWAVERDAAGEESGMVLVDVRPVDQYEGRAGAQIRRGHIPGAVNHVWSSDFVRRGDMKVWKPIDELKASYVAQGITPDKHVIAYCNTGTEASHVYFALRNLLGYPNVDVYVPSWTDWSAREELPIVGPGR